MDYKCIEELSLNNWQPLSTLLFDGWVLRFVNGYTKRANSISPQHYSTVDLNYKIKECEKIYYAKHLPPIFKITPFVHPQNLDAVLEQMNYELIDYTSVQMINLENINKPTYHSIKIDTDISSEWLNHFCRLNKVEEKNKTTMGRMLSNIATKKCFISLFYKNKVIACGIGVIEREFIGLYDIVTDSKYRNQGFGEQLILNLLKWGVENGATNSYLAVLLNYEPALKLYSKIGYTEVYKYWYRVK